MNRSGLLHRIPVLLLAASAAMLGGAFAFQYIGGLRPCILCLWQRWPHAAVIVLALLVLASSGRRRFQAFLIALAGLALLIGAGIAFFHVGVEQQWWEGTASCGGTLAGSGAGSISDITEQLLATPVTRCDAVAWSLLGVSMAGYNFLFSLILGIVALLSAGRLAKQA